MLINKDLPQKLAEFKIAASMDMSYPQLLLLASDLIDMMEAELVCEGLLNANP